MCASVSSFKVAFIQGRGLGNKRACICIRCMLSAGEGAVKKRCQRWTKRTRTNPSLWARCEKKGSSELGSGWKLTEKEFGLVPRGDKSLEIPPCIQPENGREEQHAERRGRFLFFLTRHEKEVCCSKKNAAFKFRTKLLKTSCTTTNSILSKQRSSRYFLVF